MLRKHVAGHYGPVRCDEDGNTHFISDTRLDQGQGDYKTPPLQVLNPEGRRKEPHGAGMAHRS